MLMVRLLTVAAALLTSSTAIGLAQSNTPEPPSASPANTGGTRTASPEPAVVAKWMDQAVDHLLSGDAAK